MFPPKAGAARGPGGHMRKSRSAGSLLVLAVAAISTLVPFGADAQCNTAEWSQTPLACAGSANTVMSTTLISVQAPPIHAQVRVCSIAPKACLGITGAEGESSEPSRRLTCWGSARLNISYNTESYKGRWTHTAESRCDTPIEFIAVQSGVDQYGWGVSDLEDSTQNNQLAEDFAGGACDCRGTWSLATQWTYRLSPDQGTWASWGSGCSVDGTRRELVCYQHGSATLPSDNN